MIREDIVQRCLDLGANDVICNKVESHRKQIRFANNEITASKVWDTHVISLFMAMGKKVVMTSIRDMNNVEGAVDALVRFANVMGPKDDYYGIATGPYSYPPAPYEELDVVEEDVVESVFSIADDCRAAGVIYNTHTANEIATSSDIHGRDEGSALEISVRMFADKQASGHAVSCARRKRDFDAEGACNEARDIAKMSLGAKMGTEGRFDILLSPLCMGNIIDQIAFQTSAFYVDSGLSFLKDKIGQEVASPMVDLYDDATRPDGLGSGKFDEEGVPSRKNTIIEGGELKTYLHNTSTAKKHGVETTANAGLISPEPTNIVLNEGDHNFDELLEELGNGLYITNNWYTRFQNYSTGDFSTIPRDGIFVVKDGEIAAPIKEIRISDNMQRLLKNIEALGNESRHIHWWEAETPCFTPHVLVRNINVTKSRG